MRLTIFAATALPCLALVWGEASAQPDMGRAQAVPLAFSGADAARGPTRSPEIRVWKRITLGTYKGIGGLRRAFEAARVRVGDSAGEVLGRPAFHFTEVRTQVDLVLVSVSDLGFDDATPLSDIHRRASELGLELCPPDVAPVLRLAYPDQPPGEILNVAMRPVATYAGEPIMLSIGNAGTGLLLLGGDGRPEMMMNSQVRFVFVRPARIASPHAK